MDKQFHPTYYGACDYLSMPELKLIHVSKGAPAINPQANFAADLLDKRHPYPAKSCGRGTQMLYVINCMQMSTISKMTNNKLTIQYWKKSGQ